MIKCYHFLIIQSSNYPIIIMNIKLNGKPYSIEGEASIKALAERLKLAPTQVAIERNREIVPRSRYGEVMLAPGDEVEIVSFIGGG